MAAENSGGDSKGASSLKRIKISKAQKTMFLFVCGASLLLGVTVALGIYLGRDIIFVNRLNKQKQIVIEGLKKDQNSLQGMSAQIDELTTNEYLESVATDRFFALDCSDFKGINTTFSDYETAEEIEKARRCSSLRVVHDAMPSTSKAITLDDIDSTTRIQLDLILDKAGVDMYQDEDSYMKIEDYGKSSSSSSDLIEPYGVLDIKIGHKANLENIKSFLSIIDDSIRNFDLRNAKLEFRLDGIKFDGEYYSYYTNPVDLQVQKRVICADDESDECIQEGGDQSIKED